MKKVVINGDYGGFSISLEAAKFMANRGNEQAKSEIDDYEKKKQNLDIGFYGFGYTYQRDDPDLVAAVETLGERASGSCASLMIVEIPDDVDWQIEEYDGMEWISERHRVWR